MEQNSVDNWGSVKEKVKYLRRISQEMICHLTMEISIELLDTATHHSKGGKHPYLHTEEFVRRIEDDILIFKNNFGRYHKLMTVRQDQVYMVVRRNVEINRQKISLGSICSSKNCIYHTCSACLGCLGNYPCQSLHRKKKTWSCAHLSPFFSFLKGPESIKKKNRGKK